MAAPPTGLTSTEAAERLRRDGPNALPIAAAPSTARQLGRELVHFFALMLWGAAALAAVARLPELAVAIAAVVVANAVFAFAQEHRAERAAQRLRDLLPRRSVVIRDGRRTVVEALDLVVGDLVLLAAGDRISADATLVSANALAVDLSLLSGESEPAHPNVGDAVYAGTFVVEGEATAEVVATGTKTRLAGIATLTQAASRPASPLARELRRLVRTVASIAVAVGLTFFAVGVLVGLPAEQGLLFGIGVMVALVPEGLLPTVTLTLALAAQRMARRSALVRRLESVETLGSTTFVCADKTGTLTSNQMAVVEVWTPQGIAHVSGSGYEPTGDINAPRTVRAALRMAAVVGVRCSSGRAVVREGRWVAEGDPTEVALDVLARRIGVDIDHEDRAEPTTRRFPFDPRRRRMSLATTRRIIVKGAPDSVMSVCRTVPAGAEEALASMTRRGQRVIAVAQRRSASAPAGPEQAESDLELVGLLGLEDPPRPHAAAAIAACRRAGIRVAMITGDHPATALAVAREVGLATGRSVFVGAELPRDEEELGHLLDRDGTVVARVAPEDKLRIARALQARGHVVAMTGDGVNDGPALRQADVGIAMGASGTDVAREAADLVLLDDDIATIVAAIEHGRSTFANIRRFLTYHLSDNVAELAPFVVWALSGGRFPLALTVLQILALDLGTDTLSAVALGAEPPRGDVLRAPPVRGRLLDALVARRAFAVLGPTEAIMGLLAFVVTMAAGGWRPGAPFAGAPLLLQASGATFVTIALAQTANAFACRSTSRRPWVLGWGTNRVLVTAVLIELAVTATFVFVPGAAAVLRHATPTATGWVAASLAIPAVLAADTLDKAHRSRCQRGRLRAPEHPIPVPRVK